MQDLADATAWEESELGKLSEADIAQASKEHSFNTIYKRFILCIY